MRKLIYAVIVAVMLVSITACGNKDGVNSSNTEIVGQATEVTVIQAEYPEYETNKELIEKADLIFTGVIINASYEYLDVKSEQGKDPMTGLDEASKIPYTIYEIKVTQLYKGNKQDETIYIKCPGGKVGEDVYVSELQNRMEIGIEYLFLAETYDTSYPSLLNDTQALYSMENADSPELSEILELLQTQ